MLVLPKPKHWLDRREKSKDAGVCPLELRWWGAFLTIKVRNKKGLAFFNLIELEPRLNPLLELCFHACFLRGRAIRSSKGSESEPPITCLDCQSAITLSDMNIQSFYFPYFEGEYLRKIRSISSSYSILTWLAENSILDYKDSRTEAHDWDSISSD